MSKIAVIGGGIFGSTVAIKLAHADHDVTLMEQYSDILQAASGINQYRLHRGYHYPRSSETAQSSRAAEPSFLDEYGEAATDRFNHHYCIAKNDSKVTGDYFLRFCDANDLEYELTTLPCVDPSAIDLIIKAKEFLVDPVLLRSLIKRKLEQSGVKVRLNYLADESIFDDYDIVVNCTYANLNFILKRFPEAQRTYQFELCEKPILKLPQSFKDISLVVMDGPFMCIDPYCDTAWHVAGNVTHAIHSTNTGLFPLLPKEFAPLLNRGVISNPPITNVKKFLTAAAEFLPDIAKGTEHVGSMYTFRTVLPNVDHTDERPTLVYRINDQIINVFSGKIGNSAQAAEEVLRLVGRG
ncbi:MAG: FAD-dependent oxidoreductase [Patescibacteria group bacterium]|nr:FAD-dependent oxidoreductase [Patescibacteria group bacterium]